MRSKCLFEFIIAVIILSSCTPAIEQQLTSTLPVPISSSTVTITPTKTRIPTNTPTSTPVAEIVSSKSAFCKYTSTKENVFLPNPDIHVPEGFKAEYFIAPSGLNTPSDIVITDENELIVASSRAGVLHKIDSDGNISVFSDTTSGYALGQDASGNIFVYDMPSGEIDIVSKTGQHRFWSQLPPTACESPMVAAPDGTIYVGFNDCGQASMYKIPPGGGNPQEILHNFTEYVYSLDISRGLLFGVIDRQFVSIDPSNGKMRTIAEIPDNRGAFHGLVIAENGDAYISTGDPQPPNRLYRISPQGIVTQIADIPLEGFQGIALSGAGEIIGVQRRVGGVLSISSDGNIKTIVKPNGLVSPQALAFSPCGDLININDEAGWATIIAPDGSIKPFVFLISYQPPQTFFAFSREGWFVTGEAAPGLSSAVKLYPSSGNPRQTNVLVNDVPSVSGVAIDIDNNIYVSSTGDGTIYMIDAVSKKREITVGGLSFPQDLALAPDGTFYVVTGSRDNLNQVFNVPVVGRSLISILPDGTSRPLANIPGASDIVLGADELLYVASRDGEVFRVLPSGGSQQFATGFLSARGVAFDIEGNLYVADDSGNSIIRISGFDNYPLKGEVVNISTQSGIGGAYLHIVNHYPPFAGRIIQVDPTGFFQINIAPGTYDLKVWAEGYLLTEQQLLIDSDTPDQIFKLTSVE